MWSSHHLMSISELSSSNHCEKHIPGLEKLDAGDNRTFGLSSGSRMAPGVDTTGMTTASMLASVSIAELFEEMVFIGQPFTKMAGEGKGVATAAGVDATGTTAASMLISVSIAESFKEMAFIGQPFTETTGKDEGLVKSSGIEDNGLLSYWKL